MVLVWVTLCLQNYLVGLLETPLFSKVDKNNPVLYIRYVDDIYRNFWKDVLFNNFHEKLNKLHVSLH